MATKTVKVKPGQTYADLGYDPKELMKLNPGVPRLSAGQTIKVPANSLAGAKAGGGTEEKGAYGGSYNPTATPTVRTTQINALTGQTPRTSGATPAAVGDNSGYGPIGYSGNVITGVNTVNNTSLLTNRNSTPTGFNNPHPYRQADQRPAYPATSYMNPNLVQTQKPQIQAADGTVSPQTPSVPFNPNDTTSAQQWRNLWNWQAQHPAESKAAIQAKALAEGKPDPFAPVVMTKQQIWEMKARQRRKAAANQDAGNSFNPTFTPSYAPEVSSEPYWNFGNATTSASWRIG